MVEWFHERYISRGEHREVVEYYRKLVVQLHRKVRDLRAQVDAQALDAVIEHSRRLAERESQRSTDAPSREYGGNVVRLDFRRRPN